jgi:hypothetical protein
MFDVGSFSLGALLGIVFGAFLGHALAIRRERSKISWQAASNFREAFVVARKRIEAGENEVIVIADQYPVHENARLKFVDYLSGKTAKVFAEDWHNYKEWHEALCNRSTEKVFYESNDPNYLEKKGIRATTLIEGLLNHARV